jgi:hypothetical protein
MVEYSDRNKFWNDFKAYLQKVNISSLDTDIDLAVFFKKFIDKQYNKENFKEFTETLLNGKWRGEIHIRGDLYGDSDYILDFRNLKVEDYKFIEEHGDADYKVLQYFEYLTYPAIPCYVVGLKE